MPALTTAPPSHSASQTSPDAQAHLIPDPTSLADEQRDDQPHPAKAKHSEKSLEVFDVSGISPVGFLESLGTVQSQCIQMTKLDQEDKTVPGCIQMM
jgi:hypothetical protein